MKKATLLIAMIFTISLAYSQSFFKITRVNVLEYNTYDHKWDTKNTNDPDNMMVIINGAKIKVTDNANSAYMTYGQEEKKIYTDHKATIWSAYDEKGRDCSVIITQYDGYKRFYLTVLYYASDRGYEYICEPQD